MCIQALRAQSTIERLDQRVVRRLAGAGEVEHDVVGRALRYAGRYPGAFPAARPRSKELT